MANEQDQNKQGKDWAQIIDKSRKDNADDAKSVAGDAR